MVNPLWWIVDNALWCYVLLGFIAVVLVVLWWNNRRNGLLLASAGLIALMVLVWVLTLFIETDRMQIRRHVYEMADAVAEQQPDKLVRHLADDFNYHGITKNMARKQIEGLVGRYQLEEVIVFTYELEALNRAQKYARAAFRVRVRAAREGMFLCRGEFVLENGKWRLQTIKVYNAFVNTDSEFRIPFGN